MSTNELESRPVDRLRQYSFWTMRQVPSGWRQAIP
jgi:uncharacterized protein YbdZ (MbtH family)